MKKIIILLFWVFFTQICQKAQSTQVHMLEQKHTTIFLSSQVDDSIMLQTSGLEGCCAVALIIRLHSGAYHLIMSHFPNYRLSEQRHTLVQHLATLNQDEMQEITLVVVVADEWVQNETKEWTLVPNQKNQEHAQQLGTIVGTPPIILTYDPCRTLPDQPDLAIVCGPNKIVWQCFADNYTEHSIN